MQDSPTARDLPQLAIVEGSLGGPVLQRRGAPQVFLLEVEELERGAPVILEVEVMGPMGGP